MTLTSSRQLYICTKRQSARGVLKTWRMSPSISNCFKKCKINKVKMIQNSNGNCEKTHHKTDIIPNKTIFPLNRAKINKQNFNVSMKKIPNATNSNRLAYLDFRYKVITKFYLFANLKEIHETTVMFDKD